MRETLELDIRLALVSVRKGRGVLRKMLARGARVTITITGQLVDTWGTDDGVDQEFEMEVTSTKARAAIARAKGAA